MNETFKPSENPYDWLGSGVYFWEANPDRAFHWAKTIVERRRPIPVHPVKPFVVGAVIDLGFCLDMISTNGLTAVQAAHEKLQRIFSMTNEPMPQNSGGDDQIFRELDCAVLNYLHQSRKEKSEPEFDSVRGVFTEGKPLYAGSGFRERTHIQICIRNTACIKGVFRVPQGHFTQIN